jgi:glutathione reductase (NADPH)
MEPKREKRIYGTAPASTPLFYLSDRIDRVNVRLRGRRVGILGPVDLKIPGAEHAVTSEQFLELELLPEPVLSIGGGYISFEFAHIAARAGARVTFLHRGQRPLERFDPNLVDRLVSRTRDLGVDVRLGLKVTGIIGSSTGVKIRAHSQRGDP